MRTLTSARAVLGLAVFLGACGEDAPPVPPPTPAPGGPGSARAATPGPPRAAAQRDQDLCQAIERDALARALGIAALGKVAGTGIKGGRGPASRTCSFHAAGTGNGGSDSGVSVAIRFVGEAQLEAKDYMGRFQWEPLVGLGTPAAIGRGQGGVHLQGVAQRVRVQLSVAHAGRPPAEVELAAVAAMKLVLAQVPADAADRLVRR